MNRNFLIALLLAGFVTLAHAQTAVPNKPSPNAAVRPVPAVPQLGAKSYLLMDFNSGRILVEQNADLQVEPASITKLMTSYVVFKELAEGSITLEETAVVSENAWRTGGSRMFIEPGMQVSVEDLIKGMVIQSGNDASVALAEHVAGSEEAFASLMNLYAESLGLNGTSFMNSTGLPDPQHYTTERDIVLLSAAIIREFPGYYAWYSEKEFTFNNIRQHNRNTLLWRDPAIDGLKTGHTEAGGFGLAGSVIRDGRRLILVVNGIESAQSRANESQRLIEWGFREFANFALFRAGETVDEANVWLGTEAKVPLVLAEDLVLTLPRRARRTAKVKVVYTAPIPAPINACSEIGVSLIRSGPNFLRNPSVTA